MRFKCPVCQTILELDESCSQISCSHCESRFNKEKIIAERDRQLAQKEKPVASPIVVEQKKQPPRAAFINKETGAILRERNRRSAKKLYIRIGISILAAAVLMTLVWVLVSQNSDSNKHIVASDSDQLEANRESTHVPTKESEIPPLQISSEKKVQPAFYDLDVPDSKIAKPSNQFKSKKTLTQTWFNVKPYLVELQARTPTGIRNATGIIVDSGGLVATSYLAVKGANDIYLRRASDLFGPDQDRLVDKVRGYVAVEPEHDLVLLTINRRFVDTFEEIQFATDRKLVKSLYVIQCQPPTGLYPYSTEETIILEKAKSDRLNESTIERIQRRRLATDVEWLMHRSRSPLKPGAPLTDDVGQVLAMNTAAFNIDERNTLSLPIKYVAKLRDASKNADVMPLPVKQIQSGKDISDDEGGFPVVEFGSDSREVSEKLNRLGEKCDLFSWWPETADDESALVAFMQVFLDTKKVIEADAPEAATLKKQLGIWREKIELNLGVNTTRTEMEQIEFNKKFASGTKKEKMLIGYSTVTHQASVLQRKAIGQENPGDAVAVKLKGTDLNVAFNIRESWPRMLPESPWLVIGKILDSPPLNIRSQVGSKEFESHLPCRIGFVFHSD